jgi:hypothetical protein
MVHVTNLTPREWQPCLLVKNLKRTKKALEKEGQLEEAARYDFFPQTYVLPAAGGCTS